MTATLRSTALVMGLLVGVSATPPPASAAGVEIKLGTLGAGIDLAWPLSDTLTGRIGLNRYSYGSTLEEGGIAYSADLDLKSSGLFLDWHPFRGTFRLTAGYLSNDNAISGRATGDIEVGSTVYSGVDLRGTIAFSSGTYLGLGWGNRATKGWTLTADIGVLHQGSPKVGLSDASLQVSSDDLDQEAAELADGLSDFDLYPVVGLGISYAF